MKLGEKSSCLCYRICYCLNFSSLWVMLNIYPNLNYIITYINVGSQSNVNSYRQLGICGIKGFDPQLSIS